MKKKLKLTVLWAAVLTFICTSAGASEWSGAVEGTYIPLRGRVTTMEVGIPAFESGINVGIQQPTQLGKFVIVLARKGWSSLSAEEQIHVTRFLVMHGEVRGITDLGENPPTTNHVLTNRLRDGAVYTSGDRFVAVSAGDATCSQGMPLTGVEQINVVAGIGRYAGLMGGQIYVQGTVGNCPFLPSFLKNDFKVVSGAGGLTFGPLQ